MNFLQPVALANGRNVYMSVRPSPADAPQTSMVEPSWSDTGPVPQLVLKTNRPPTRWGTLRHDKARFSRDFTGNCGGLEPAGTRWNPLGWWTRDGHEAAAAPSASASAGGVNSKPCKNRTAAAARQAGVA